MTKVRVLNLLTRLALAVIVLTIFACGGNGDTTEDRPTTTGEVEASNADSPAALTGERSSESHASLFVEATMTPGDAAAPVFTDAQAQICPQRQPDPGAMISPARTSPETDKEALMALFRTTDGEAWDDSGTWAGFAPIGEWHGVAVDGDGRVTDLALSGLSGELPPDLGNLSRLQTLYITDGQLEGELPPELRNLSGLEVLSFGGNRLCGEVPSELRDLTELRVLNLSGNQLIGEVPSWLARLSSLETLDLSNNQLTGKLPPYLEDIALGMSLDLRGNKFVGCKSDFLRDWARSDNSLPVCAYDNHAGDTEALIALFQAWGEPDSLLRWKWLSREPVGEWEGISVGLDGRVAAFSFGWSTHYAQPLELPAALGDLSSLRLLRLDIGFTGEIPPELGNLTNLQYLTLGGQFTG
ncbi:MAG: hypothetical protein OXK79_09805 [Chloroflexota bacterium]|nr:hypothetical protein [Chloroflexota bacterium]